MEEKERFEYYPRQNQLYDKISDELYCLGIKQDKTRLVDFLNLMNEDWWTLYERNKELREENQQLKQQLAEKEEQIKDAREAGNMAVDSWCKNRRKYEAQIAEMQNKSFILYSMLYETLEKQGCDNVASQIDQMTGWTYDKEADWLNGNRNYDQLKQQLHDLPKKIVEYFYDEIRHRAILEDDYCPDHNLERKYGIRKCLLENIRTTILEKFGGEDDL